MPSAGLKSELPALLKAPTWKDAGHRVCPGGAPHPLSDIVADLCFSRSFLTAIILLSFVLALSFLLIILSCALYANWLPLFVAAIFAFAPLPNFIFSRCAGGDEFSGDYSQGPKDFGHFLTSVFLVSGVALPFVLAHSGVISEMAGYMSGAGGAVGYATIITYSHFFKIQIADF